MKKIGAAITHHFHKHRKRIANHVIKHHKKYIWGLGCASGIATFKLFVLIFGIGFGLSPQHAYGQMEGDNIPIANDSASVLNDIGKTNNQ